MKKIFYSFSGILLLCIATNALYGQTTLQTATPAIAPGEIPQEYTYSVDSLALYIDCHYDEEKSKVRPSIPGSLPVYATMFILLLLPAMKPIAKFRN